MTQDDWDLIYRSTSSARYRVTARRVEPHARRRATAASSYTSSAAGIYGNFGQANYAMAKLGLVRLLAARSRSRASKKNVLVNTIAPIAGSRMTETVLPKELLDALKPEYVSPLVARARARERPRRPAASSRSAAASSRSSAGSAPTGKTFRLGRAITPERRRRRAWKDDHRASTRPTHPADITESMQPIIGNLEAEPRKGGNEFIDVDAALGYEFPDADVERTTSATSRSTRSASAPRQIRPTRGDLAATSTRCAARASRALPTFGVVPALNMVFDDGQARRDRRPA